MINIINTKVNYDDWRVITSLELKLKHIREKEEVSLTNQGLVATVSAAFFQTTLLTDENGTLKIHLDPKRSNVVDLVIRFSKKNKLTFSDIDNFITAFQKAVDNTKLF